MTDLVDVVDAWKKKCEMLQAELEALKAQEPVATVRIQIMGGNAGIAWHAVPTENAPLMRDGDLLYAAPKPGDKSKAGAAWADVPDATQWLEDLRGNTGEPT